MGKKKSAIPNFGKPRISPSQVRTLTLTEAEIRKIKEDAVEQAVKILEDKYDAQKLRDEGYYEAIGDAQRYFIVCGCKALHELFGFGYTRLWRFVNKVADLKVDTVDGTTELETLENWLWEEIGMRLESKSMDDEIKERQEATNGSNQNNID